MKFDWITWSVWGFGLFLLTYWCFETFREFRALFRKHKEEKGGPRG